MGTFSGLCSLSAVQLCQSQKRIPLSKLAVIPEVAQSVIPEVVVGNPQNPWVPDNDFGNDDIFAIMMWHGFPISTSGMTALLFNERCF